MIGAQSRTSQCERQAIVEVLHRVLTAPNSPAQQKWGLGWRISKHGGGTRFAVVGLSVCFTLSSCTLGRLQVLGGVIASAYILS